MLLYNFYLFVIQILTFDYGGVSGHLNHRSLPDGMQYLLSTFSASSSSHSSTVISPRPRLFTLITRPLLLKYIGILAPLLAKFDVLASHRIDLIYLQFLNVIGHVGIHFDIFRPKELQDHDTGASVFVSGAAEYATALRAMRAHESQLVWFRWLYVAFSRYMWVNEWVEMTVDRE